MTTHLSVRLPDHTTASLRWGADGRCTVRYSALPKALVLPVGVRPTVGLVERMYNKLRA